MRIWLVFVLLLTLVPLSVDNIWNIPFLDYDIRVNYIGAALSVFTLLFFAIRRNQETIQLLRSEFMDSSALPWVCFAGVGLFSMLESVVFQRSLFFWIWSIGTLAGVPLICRFFHLKFQSTFFRWVILYYSVQCLILLIDSLICIPTGGAMHIARVMIYPNPSGLDLCRPHVFYQEPGYFAGFSLLMLVFSRAWMEFEKNPHWRRVGWLTLVLGVAATVGSTSRLGWLGCAVFVGYEALSWFYKRFEKQLKSYVFTIQGNFRLIPKFCFSLVVFIVLMFGVMGYERFHAAFYGKGNVDPSFLFRFSRSFIAWDKIVPDHRWIGVGPGSAGAYLVDTFPQHHSLYQLSPDRLQSMRKDPYSLDLYTEIFSEWGALGFFFFISFLIFKSRHLPLFLRFQLLSVLGVIYLSSQTLPRFDLWFVLGSVWALPYSRKESISS